MLCVDRVCVCVCMFWPCDLCVCVCLSSGYPAGYPTTAPAYTPNIYQTGTPGYPPGEALHIFSYILSLLLWCIHSTYVWHDLVLSVPLFIQDIQQEPPIRCPRHRRMEPLRRTRHPRAHTPRPCILSEVPTLNKTSTLRWAMIHTHTIQPKLC